MSYTYELHEALLRVERAAREYVAASGAALKTRARALKAALDDLDTLRARIDHERRGPSE